MASELAPLLRQLYALTLECQHPALEIRYVPRHDSIVLVFSGGRTAEFDADILGPKADSDTAKRLVVSEIERLFTLVPE